MHGYYRLEHPELLKLVDTFEGLWDDLTLSFIALGEQGAGELVMVWLSEAAHDNPEFVIGSPRVPEGFFWGQQLIPSHEAVPLLRQIINGQEITTTIEDINHFSLTESSLDYHAVVDVRQRSYLFPTKPRSEGTGLFLQRSRQLGPTFTERLRRLNEACDSIAYDWHDLISATAQTIGIPLRIGVTGWTASCLVPIPARLSVLTEHQPGGSQVSIDLAVPSLLIEREPTLRLLMLNVDGSNFRILPEAVAKIQSEGSGRITAQITTTKDVSEVVALVRDIPFAIGFPAPAAREESKAVITLGEPNGNIYAPLGPTTLRLVVQEQQLVCKDAYGAIQFSVPARLVKAAVFEDKGSGQGILKIIGITENELARVYVASIWAIGAQDWINGRFCFLG